MHTSSTQLSNIFCLNSAIMHTLILNLATKKTPRATKLLLNNAKIMEISLHSGPQNELGPQTCLKQTVQEVECWSL